jgi:dynein heavy chain
LKFDFVFNTRNHLFKVPGMFARDEMDEICQELVPVMKKQFPIRPPTNENLYDYFLTRVRQNLHVVLCFSPVGEKFRKRGKSKFSFSFFN